MNKERMELAKEIIKNKRGRVLKVDDTNLYVEFTCVYGHPPTIIRPEVILGGNWCPDCDKQKKKRK